ncbi:MAG TPA: hypothetical protein VFU15_13735, partial [Bacteroidia bacterium]|nr:hypothetical protein [Bacteroidia bacterium]
VLIAEQYYVIENASTSVSNGKTYTEIHYSYYYNDVMALNFNGSGGLDWKAKIAKRQRSEDDGGLYSSYLPYYKDNKLYIIYNDTPKNQMMKPGGAPEYFIPGKDCQVVMAVIDEKGNVSRESIPGISDGKFMICPSSSKVYPGAEIMLYLSDFKSYKFARVNIK